MGVGAWRDTNEVPKLMPMAAWPAEDSIEMPRREKKTSLSEPIYDL